MDAPARAFDCALELKDLAVAESGDLRRLHPMIFRTGLNVARH
jgi:hypothetical protein